MSLTVKKITAAMTLTISVLAPTANATLYDRGSGLLYDDVLDVTWLQDANFAKTSGYDADGMMSWAASNTWASNLIYHDSVRNVNYTDWRLPTMNPVGTTYNGKFSFDGSTDEGYNIISPNSELAYMFYVNLNLKGYYSPTGTVQAGYGALGNGGWGTADVGLVRNLKSDIYWTGTVYAPFPTLNAWMFDAHWGYQNFYSQWDQLYAWAVRDGDVAALTSHTLITAIPEPESYEMLLAGLGLLTIASYLRRHSRCGHFPAC